MTKQHRPCYLQVSLDAIEDNIHALQNQLADKGEVLPVLKADGYGLGATCILKKATQLGIRWVATSLLEEAIVLRAENKQVQILMLGGWQEDDIPTILEYGVTPLIYSAETAAWLQNYGKKINKTIECHLDLDTGMTRTGFTPSEFKAWLANKENYTALQVTGISSHFASADRDALAFTKQQYQIYKECCRQAKAVLPLTWFHISNSAAALQENLQLGNLFRIGIGVYGYLPSAFLSPRTNVTLTPCASWFSSIIQIHTIQAGETVSYGGQFRATRTTKVATIAVGYADGFPRNISRDAYVLVKGQKAPLIGAVCMDMIMVDITNLHHIQVNDTVTLIGKSESAEISAETFANWQDTIVYEVFCRISPRVPRTYLDSTQE